MTDRAEYFVNIWESRDAVRDPAPDVFLNIADAIEQIADGFTGWRYVETIWRKADGTFELLHLDEELRRRLRRGEQWGDEETKRRYAY